MKEQESDLNDVLFGFTNYVQNERVRCFNEGVDAMKADNAKLRAALKEAGEAMLDWHCLSDGERDEITNKTRAITNKQED